MVVKISKNRIDVAAGQVQNAELATCSYTTVVADSGSAYTINLSAGNSFYIKLTANCTFTFSNPPASGKTGTFELILKQDMTGGRTVSWPKSVLWPAKTAPTLTTTAQGGDILRFHTSDGGTTWFGAASASVFDMASTLSPLFVWGSNSWGELGLGDAANRSAPVQLGDSDWASTSSGKYNGYSITSTGQLFAWGHNAYGQLGIGDTVSRSSPVQVGSDTNWSVVSGGLTHVMALKTNGTLYEWGYNGYGELGTGDVVFRSSPVQIGSNTNWAQVAAGANLSLALTTDGKLFSWGFGSAYGSLGVGAAVDSSSPVQVGTGTNWAKIYGGRNCAFAIKTDGTLWSWGRNDYGQLGLSSVAYRSSPVQVGTNTNWKQVSSAYDLHTLAVTTDGKLFGWGYNYYGQLGIGSSGAGNMRSSPVQVGTNTNWAQVSASGYGGMASTTDGKLFTWGYNAQGQLGLGDTTDRNSPVQVGTSTKWSVLSGGLTTFSLGIQSLQTSAPVATGYALYSWGNNSKGELGQGDAGVHRSTPVQVGNSTNWTKISTGFKTSFGVTTDGKLYAWGYNVYGQLGLLDVVYRSSPIQVGTGTNWASVKAGLSTIALKTDGTLWTWGEGSYGELGLGNGLNRSSPTQVGANTNWAQIAADYISSFAITTDGKLFAWGRNLTFGQLGLGDTVNRSSPVQVGTGTSWAKIAASLYSVLALTTDGKLFSWGNNASGQLGLGDVVKRSSPVQVGTGTNWADMSIGQNCVSAVTTDGKLFTWGSDTSGESGRSDAVARSSPVQIGTGTDWAKTWVGGDGGFAMKTDGTLWGWGYNTYGDIGIGDTFKYWVPTQVGTDTNWKEVSKGNYVSWHVLALKSTN